MAFLRNMGLVEPDALSTLSGNEKENKESDLPLNLVLLDLRRGVRSDFDHAE